MHDRYGPSGFLAAYNEGPKRYEEYLATGRALPTETQLYVPIAAPMIAGRRLKALCNRPTRDPLAGSSAICRAWFSQFVVGTGYRTDAERIGWSLVFGGFVPEGTSAMTSRDGPSWWVRGRPSRSRLLPRGRSGSAQLHRRQPRRARASARGRRVSCCVALRVPSGQGRDRRVAQPSGAEGGNRTHTPFRAPDFESGASANSATSARAAHGRRPGRSSPGGWSLLQLRALA